ncbi:hypothetical protein XELAEV_18026092mg [Xenopus laevis]|uniref:Uncharacterized protein n=1 Tax=Xenopus laevis TaxID=8355 RepID=A0A974CTM8_XENLA|nr:hypothetical protein XELAEV_18026092mg [Xenopus laevis]
MKHGPALVALVQWGLGFAKRVAIEDEEDTDDNIRAFIETTPNPTYLLTTSIEEMMDDLDEAIEVEDTRNLISITIILIVGFLIVSLAVTYLVKSLSSLKS